MTRRAALVLLAALAAPAAAAGAPAADAVVFLPGLAEAAPGATDPGRTNLAPLHRLVRRAGWRAVQVPAADRIETGGGRPGDASDDTVLGTQGALAPNVAAAGRFLRGLRRQGVRRVVLVGYSWGGLVARGVASRPPAGGPRVRAVVTVGAPHRGTPAAAACLEALAAPEASFLQTACRSLGLVAGAPALAALTPEATAAFGRRNRGGGAPLHLVAGDAVKGGPPGAAGPPPGDGVVPTASALDAGGALRRVRSRLRVNAFHTRAAVLRWDRTYAAAPPLRAALPRWVRAALGPPAR